MNKLKESIISASKMIFVFMLTMSLTFVTSDLQAKKKDKKDDDKKGIKDYTED